LRCEGLEPPMSQNGMDWPCSRQTREHTCGGNQEEEHAHATQV
jgi:hypothetical protein